MKRYPFVAAVVSLVLSAAVYFGSGAVDAVGCCCTPDHIGVLLAPVVGTVEVAVRDYAAELIVCYYYAIHLQTSAQVEMVDLTDS